MNGFRHDLIFVSPNAWRSLLDARADIASEPLAAGWVDRGWPLVARRPAPAESSGIALGLPLPPNLGKRRIPVLMQCADIVSVVPARALRDSMDAAPPAWRQTLEQIVVAAAAQGVEARVFGSLAWQALTGLDYITERSDLDLLLSLPRRNDVDRLTAALAAIEASAPMRLDGELVRDDGAGVNWREVHAGAREVMVKTACGVELLDTQEFLGSRTLAS